MGRMTASPTWGKRAAASPHSALSPWRSMSAREAGRQRRQRAKVPHHDTIALAMVQHARGPKLRHGARQRVGVQPEIVGNVDPAQGHVEHHTITARRWRTGAQGEIEQKSRHPLPAVEPADRRDMDRAAGHLTVDRLVVEACNGAIPCREFGEDRPAQPPQLACGGRRERPVRLARHEAGAQHVAGKEDGNHLAGGPWHGHVESQHARPDNERSLAALDHQRHVLPATRAYGRHMRGERGLERREPIGFGLCNRDAGQGLGRPPRIGA